MEKAITYVGNSFAIVLDRTMMQLMGVGHGSVVDITFEGDRLVIQRTGKMRLAAPRIRRVPGLGMSPSVPRLRECRTIPDPTQSILTLDFDENGELSIKRLAREHRTVVQQLSRSLGVDEMKIKALDPRAPLLFMKAVLHLSSILEKPSPTPEDIVAARRVRYCFEYMEQPQDWERVSALAIATYPWPAPESKADMSAGSGAEAATTPPSG
jgi:hypothetical protein